MIRLSLSTLLLATALGGCGACGDPADVTPDASSDGPDPATGAWRSEFRLPGLSGLDARVEVIILDAADHAYVGGVFTDAAGARVSNVATWNGADWEPMGDSIEGSVAALAIDATGA